MQIKALFIASLATLGSAAVVERQIPSQISGIYDQITSVIGPAATALPPSLISEIQTVIATLKPQDYQSFISSVVSQLPSNVQSSFLEGGASVTSEIGALTTALTGLPTATGTDGSGSSGTAEPSASKTPNAGSKTFVGVSVLGVAGILGLALAL